jgi:thiol-disulfide isomerase/thioredoxin
VLRIVLVLLVATGAARAQTLRVGDAAVDLDVAVDAAGKPYKLAALRGRWVVLAIGAAWCDPCKAELPVLDRFAGEFSAVFVALSIDNEIADGKRFHAGLKLSRLVRAYMPEESSKIAGRYGADSMPSTFVIDPQGVVRLVKKKFDHKALAAATKELHDALASVLPKKPPPAPKPSPPPPPSPTPTPAPTPPAPTPPAVEDSRAVPPIVMLGPPRASWWSTTWKLAPF